MNKAKRFDVGKIPPFGTVLRAYRLRWVWYSAIGAFVRISDHDGSRYRVETARTFEALNEGSGSLYYWGYPVDLLDKCQALQRIPMHCWQDYDCWLVDEEGKHVTT